MTPLTWQRIETAPKDGTRILTLDTNANVVIRSWTNYGYAGWSDSGQRGTRASNLTHWMPLPSPPPADIEVQLAALRQRGATNDGAHSEAESAEILSSERSTSVGPRDTALSSSLRASYLEEADHLAAIDLTDQIAHLREQARDAD